MKPFTTRALALAAGVAGAGLGAGGVALATGAPTAAPAPPSSAAAPATTASLAAVTGTATGSHHDHPALRRLLGRAVHADLLVKTTDGFETVQLDRGTVTAASASSVSIHRSDGTTVTAPVTSATRFVGLQESQLSSGDRAVVVQTGGHAVVVASRAPTSSSATGSSATGSSTTS